MVIGEGENIEIPVVNSPDKPRSNSIVEFFAGLNKKRKEKQEAENAAKEKKKAQKILEQTKTGKPIKLEEVNVQMIKEAKEIEKNLDANALKNIEAQVKIELDEELLKKIAGVDVSVLEENSEALSQVLTELETRLKAGKKVKEVMGIEDEDDEKLASLEAAASSQIGLEKAKTLARIIDRIEEPAESEQQISFRVVQEAVEKKDEKSNVKKDKSEIRREALKAAAILAEQRKLKVGQTPDRKKAIKADLDALSSDDEKDKSKQTQKFLENISALSLTVEEKAKKTELRKATDEGKVDTLKGHIEALGKDTEFSNSLEDIKEMLGVIELKEIFIANSSDLIRTQIALSTVEEDIRRKLIKYDGLKKSERPEKLVLMSEDNIKKIVRDMFPPNTALAVRAAQLKAENPKSDEYKTAQKDLQSYVLRRQILEDTLTNYASRIENNIKEFKENREATKARLIDSLQNRKGRDELNKEELSKGSKHSVKQDKVHFFLTHSGNKILFVENVDDMVALAPDLKDGDGNNLTSEQVKDWIETKREKGDDLGDSQFQMAVSVENTDGTKDSVLVIHRKKNAGFKDEELDPKSVDQLKTFGYFLGDNIPDKDLAQTMVLGSAAVVYHEMNHGINDQYQISQIEGIKKKLKEYEGKKDDDSIARVEVLTRLEAELTGGDKVKQRWKSALDELSSKLSENASPVIKKELSERSEHNNDTKIKLKDLYIFNPVEITSKIDELVTAEKSLKEEGKQDEADEIRIEIEKLRTELELVDNVDKRILEVLDIVNLLTDPKNSDIVKRNIIEKYKSLYTVPDDAPQVVKDLMESSKSEIDVSKFLQYYILSYINDGHTDGKKIEAGEFKDLEGLYNELNLLSNGLEVDESDLDKERSVLIKGVVSADPETSLRDPALIASRNLEKSPHLLKDADAHLMAPLHWSIPVPGLDFVQKYARSRFRYHVFKGLYEKNLNDAGITNFNQFWDRVQSNPAKVAEKDKGIIFTSEILGAFVRQAALQGKNPDEMLGFRTYDEASGIDKRTGKSQKGVVLKTSDKKIETGLAGRAMSAWEKAPVANWLYPRYHPAPWGMAMEKVFGRGPVSRLIGRAFWGESAMPNAEGYQKVGFSSHPKWRFVPGYKEGENKLEPDGLPGVVMQQEGNMTPKWNPDKKEWELHARIPVESVLPSNEYHRKAHLSTMLGMMAKSGIDENSLRFMVMKYLPELNFQNREGVPGYDITEYKKSIRPSDLHYRQRMRSGRYTAASYHNEVLDDLLGLTDPDLKYDLNGLDDYNTYKSLVNDENEDANWEENNKNNPDGARLRNLDNRIKNASGASIFSVPDTDITRGYVSEETVDEMIEFINTFLEKGMGAGGGREAGRVKEQAFMIRHVYRAMQYENSIRNIRKKFLEQGDMVQTGTGQRLSEHLKEWNTEVSDLADKILKNPPGGGSMGRAEALRLAYSTYIDGGTIDVGGGSITYGPKQLDFWIKNGSKQIHLDSDQIKKLFVYSDVEGAPEKFVDRYDADENSAFGIGDMEKIAFNTEWNHETNSPGVDYFHIGGGFKIHKMEVQAFQRNLYYVYSRDIMKRGLPPDAINIPGETQNYDKTITSDLWYKKPQFPPEGFVEGPKDQPHYLTYGEGYFKTQILHDTNLQNKFITLLNIEGATPADKLENLRILWTGVISTNPDGTTNDVPKEERVQNFKKIIDVLDNNPDVMTQMFGDRAQLQATFLNERNQIHTIKPVSPATELNMRFYEQGALVMETEEALTKIEDQMSFYTNMRLYLQEARRAVPYSKARSEIFKNQGKYIKYFRWAVLGVTFYSAFVSPLPGMPLYLPLPPEIYATMVALSYYDAYFLSVRAKYWGMREMNAIKYSDEMFEFTSRLEGQLRQFKIPEDEEMEQYGSLKSRYEKMFEGISDVDSEELSPGKNAATTFINSTVTGFLGSR